MSKDTTERHINSEGKKNGRERHKGKDERHDHEEESETAFVAGWERRREEISPKKTAYRPQRVFDSDRSPAYFKTGNSSSSSSRERNLRV